MTDDEVAWLAVPDRLWHLRAKPDRSQMWSKCGDWMLAYVGDDGLQVCWPALAACLVPYAVRCQCCWQTEDRDRVR